MSDTTVVAEWAVPPFERATPREARHRINRMEGWLARTSTEHDQARVLYLRRLFEYAYTPAHADFLEEEIRDLRDALRHVWGRPAPAKNHTAPRRTAGVASTP